MFPYGFAHVQSHIPKHPPPLCPSGRFPLIFRDSLWASPLWAFIPEAPPAKEKVTPTPVLPGVLVTRLVWLWKFHIKTVSLSSSEILKNNYFLCHPFSSTHASKNKQRWHKWHYWSWTTSPKYKLGNSKTLWMARLNNQEDVIYRKSRLCLKRSFKKYIYTLNMELSLYSN